MNFLHWFAKEKSPRLSRKWAGESELSLQERSVARSPHGVHLLLLGATKSTPTVQLNTILLRCLLKQQRGTATQQGRVRLLQKTPEEEDLIGIQFSFA